MMRHYFGRLSTPIGPSSRRATSSPSCARADTVVLLTVERSFWTLQSTKLKRSRAAGSVVTAPFVEAVPAASRRGADSAAIGARQ